MRKMRKNFISGLSLIVILSLIFALASCSKPTEGGQPTGKPTEAPSETDPAETSEPVNEEPVELSILMSGDNTPSEDNIVLQELGRRTNTIIKMTYVPGADHATKKSTLAASNSLPDIFNTSGDEAIEFKEGGFLAEVGDLIYKYAPNIIANIGENLEKAPINSDGIYLVLDARLGYIRQLNMRTDWLANLGMELPTDLDSLYKVLYAFTYNDPDGDGQDDTFGLCANTNPNMFATIFGAYGIPVNCNIELEDGTVTIWVKHPKFLEAMEYINKLNKDGLIEPDWATIPTMDMFGKLWNGVAGAIEWECVGPTNNWMPSRYTEDPVPTFDFPIIKGPDGSHGTPTTYMSLTSGWAFSSNCKNLEAAVKFANYCMSEEGNELLYLGIEGTMYRWIDKEAGQYELLGEYKDSATHRASGGWVYWYLFAPTHHTEIRTFNKQTQEGVALARKISIPHVYIATPLQTRLEYGADMDQLINEMYVEMLAADGDLKSIYDRYIGEWESIGGTEWEIEATKAWKAQEGN
ncbi:MAG TPA: extracellular solute-binding protein [Clostridiales bacterium]|nr:extracellular solute-binding protein [Clostridiales bacterium]